MNNDRLAIAELQSAVTKGHADKDTYKDLGLAFSNIGEYDSAVGPLVSALSIDPDDVDINIELGRILRRKGDYSGSLKYLNNATRHVSEKDSSFLKNRIANEIEISQKKVALDSHPLGLWVTLTTKCNLRCLMCDVWKNEWDLPESTIQEIQELFPYLKEVFWQGGEVFFSGKFKELFEKASLYPALKQNINTNGILINEDWAKRLSRKNVSLTFAIDGVTKNTYEGIRRGAEFERLIENLRFLNNYKCDYNKDAEPSDRMTTIMRFIVMRSNYHEIRDAVAFARKFGFDSLQLCPVEGTIMAENIFMHHDPGVSSRIRMLVNGAVEDAKESGFRLESNLPLKDETARQPEGKILKSDDSICPEAKARGLTCEFPWQYLFIGRGGVVMPSCMCVKEVGNVHKNSLSQIWNSPGMQFYRRSISEGNFRESCSRLTREMNSRFELIKFNHSVNNSPLDTEGLAEVLKNNPDITEAHILLAREYRRQGKRDLAIEEFRKALEKFPDSFEAHFELGMIFREGRNFQEAIKEFGIAAEIKPDNSEIYLEMGIVYREKEEFGKAEETLKKALSLNCADKRMHLEMGRVCLERNEFDAAIKELNIAVQIDPADDEICLELGRAYFKKAELRKAEGVLKKALAFKRGNGFIYLELARVYAARNAFSLALKQLKRAQKSGLDDCKVHLEFGRVYREIKDYGMSLKEFQKAMKLSGHDNLEIYLELGRLYQKQGKYAEAAAELNKYKDKNQTDGNIYLQLGKVYLQMDNSDSALTAFRQASAFGIKNYELCFESGKAYYRQNKIGLAINEFKKALELSPGSASAKKCLREAVRDSKKITKNDIK
jgi:tetratricopeptide (TPR) repeat protein